MTTHAEHPAAPAASETELKCRRMILTLAALLADEDGEQQMSSGGFQRALARAGLFSDRKFISEVTAEFQQAGLLRALLALPGETRWRITPKGETQLLLMGEAIEHTMRWIQERTEETLSRRATVTVCNAQEPTIDAGEATVDVCLTHAALNAWWDSLPLDNKAEAMACVYEAYAADNEAV